MTSTRKIQSVAVAGMLLAVATSGAQAQSCMGLPNVSTMSRNLTTIADAYGGQRSVLGRVGLSSKRAFGGVQAGYVGYKVQDPNRAVVGVDAGYVLPLGHAPKALQLCPFVQSLMQLGGTGNAFDNRTNHSLLGLSVGQEFRLSPRFAIAPYLDAAVSHWSYHANYTPYSPTGAAFPTLNLAYSETGGRYGAGFGLRVGEALTIRPAFHFTSGFKPTGGDAGQPGATLSLSYNFRKR